MEIINIQQELNENTYLKRNLKKLMFDAITNKTNIFYCKDNLLVQTLLESDVISKFDEDSFKINFDSEKNIVVLFELTEEFLEKKIPQELFEIFDYIGEFEKLANKDEQNHNWNELKPIIANLEKYAALYLNHVYKIEIKTLYKTLEDQSNHVKEWFFDCKESYYRQLPYMNCEVPDFYDVVTGIYKSNIESNYPFEILYKQCIVNVEKAKYVYSYGLEKNLLEYNALAAHLISCIYNTLETSVYQDILTLFNINYQEGLKAFSAVQFKNKNEQLNSFNLVKNTTFDDLKDLQDVAKYYFRIISSDLSSIELINQSFDLLGDLADLGEQKLCDHIVLYSKMQNGFEKERYQLLIRCLSNGAQKNLISDYFMRYKQPEFFFNLYMSYFSRQGLNLNSKLFEHGINHFWRVNQNKTEEILLSILTNTNLHVRLAAVQLMTLGYNTLQIDLLKIKEPHRQKLAIKPLLTYPHSIESLLPIAMQLKNTKHLEVITELETAINTLIMEAYGKGVYDITEILLDKKNDAKLLKSFTKTYKLYRANIERKNTVKDLNPYYNENDLLKYYVTLENEMNYKMTKEVTANNSMFGFYSTKTIVRGNSWKVGNREPTSLSNFSISMILDKRMILNPDLFEMNLAAAVNIND